MVFVENELIGRRLKKVRNQLGMDYVDMADLLGISDGHYRKIERGIYGLDARKLLVLYDQLKVDPLYILTGDTKRNLPVAAYTTQSDRDTMVCQLLDYCKQQLVQKGDT